MNRTLPKGLSNDRLTFRATAADKEALVALADLLRPKLPFVTRTEIVRIALREAEKALREQQESYVRAAV